MSAWQFLLPACIVGLLVGIVATTVYNPISTELRAISDQLRNSLTEKRSKQADGPIWIRQAAEGRESIIGALKTSDDGMTLTDVTAFVFDETGAFYERVDAETAQYTVGEWKIDNALVTRLEKQPKKAELVSPADDPFSRPGPSNL